MKLVVKDGSLWGFLACGLFKRFPHVHHSKPDMPGFSWPEPLIEEIHTLFRAVFASEPDRPPFLQIAYHDPVYVAFADGNLVNADHLGSWLPGTTEFFPHILYFKFLDR